MQNEILKLEKQTFEEDDSPEVPPSDIVAYNELRSCADLFRMYNKGTLNISPEFQREIVWPNPAQTRFIDSLVKQLPIPSMCFSYDYKTQRWLVIDGLQRMATIIKFLDNAPWTLSKLDDIDPLLSGQINSSFADTDSPLHQYFERVENLSVPVTVLRCDYSKKSHTNFLFTIFHRLNTGGLKLNNQEIRNCIYSGPFNDLLRNLNRDKGWIKLNKMKSETGYRFTKQELILRLFCFNDNYRKYPGGLARFLNDYMNDYKDADETFIKEKTEIFKQTVDIVLGKLFDNEAPKKQINISTLEALLVGVSLNLNFLKNQPPDVIKSFFENLVSHEEFSEEKLREGLSKKQRVIGRLSTAEKVFAGNP